MEELDVELVSMVLERLEGGAISRAMLVCRKWHSAITTLYRADNSLFWAICDLPLHPESEEEHGKWLRMIRKEEALQRQYLAQIHATNHNFDNYFAGVAHYIYNYQEQLNMRECFITMRFISAVICANDAMLMWEANSFWHEDHNAGKYEFSLYAIPDPTVTNYTMEFWMKLYLRSLIGSLCYHRWAQRKRCAHVEDEKAAANGTLSIEQKALHDKLLYWRRSMINNPHDWHLNLMQPLKNIDSSPCFSAITN